jgi:hypothetical protein
VLDWLLRRYFELYIRWLTWRGYRPVSQREYNRALVKKSP